MHILLDMAMLSEPCMPGIAPCGDGMQALGQELCDYVLGFRVGIQG